MADAWSRIGAPDPNHWGLYPAISVDMFECLHAIRIGTWEGYCHRWELSGARLARMFPVEITRRLAVNINLLLSIAYLIIGWNGSSWLQCSRGRQKASPPRQHRKVSGGRGRRTSRAVLSPCAEHRWPVCTSQLLQSPYSCKCHCQSLRRMNAPVARKLSIFCLQLLYRPRRYKIVPWFWSSFWPITSQHRSIIDAVYMGRTSFLLWTLGR